MQTVAPAPTTEPAVIPTSAPGAGLALTAAERQAGSQQAAVAANPSQGMEGYQDEITQNVSPADSPAAMKPGDGNGKKTPVDQGKTQEAQQEGQEAQQDGQKAQQETQTANDGKNQKGQGQGQSANGPQQDATKAGGFSLFSRVHQHHHYQEPLAGAQPPAEAQPSAGANSAQDANPAPASGTNAPMQNAPQVSKRDTLGVMDMINQAPVSPEEINVMNNRVKREGLTPEIHDGIQNISARGQRDVKDQKLTPEQLQKNAHALNQLGDTVNNQPDSPQKKAIMEHIQKLGQMLMEAIKRIFSLGRASTGPSM
jgi:hypothetical protein